MKISVETTKFEGVFLFTPKIFEDSRGKFFESFNKEEFEALTGVETNFIQDNTSHSKKGVLRGLHYQIPPYGQSKLISVSKGNIIDCIVDLRPDSKTFTQHGSFFLSKNNQRHLYIPKGFAHGFYAFSKAVINYKVDGRYNPEAERILKWDEIQFGFRKHFFLDDDEDVILSDKDKNGITMKECVKEIKEGRNKTQER